jgi:proton-translocating NAD(P)+ transhydrogenase subunit alpha
MKVKTLGVLDERTEVERRVALVPDTVRRLCRDGMAVIVESGAGEGAWYPNQSYLEAGATIGSRRQVLERADVIPMVSRPRGEDVSRLRAGQAVIGMLDPEGDPQLVSALAGRGVLAVSLDRVPRTVSRAQSMDVLTSQASVAGYKAVLLAADAFGRYFPMLITAAGTSRPASLLVLGAGVAGLSAIGTARRLGAVVTGYDIRPETRAEVESLGAKFLRLATDIAGEGAGGYARELSASERAAQQAELEEKLAGFDIIVATAQVPGRKPPVLVTKAALARMRRGAVVIDMAASELGGNVEGSSPGTSTVTSGGVTVVGASDLPSAVPTAASDALSQNMAATIALFVHEGEFRVDTADEVQTAIVVAGQDGLTASEGRGPGGAPKEGVNERIAAI